MIFKYGWEVFLIQRIWFGFEAMVLSIFGTRLNRVEKTSFLKLANPVGFNRPGFFDGLFKKIDRYVPNYYIF